jgi:hypothetical protein
VGVVMAVAAKYRVVGWVLSKAVWSLAFLVGLLGF